MARVRIFLYAASSGLPSVGLTASIRAPSCAAWPASTYV